MKKFYKKVQYVAVLVCGIVFTLSIFTACNKDDDEVSETEDFTKRLTHFSISSNRADYDYDTATFYYEYDELGRLSAINSYTTFQFFYIGNSNFPEILRRIKRPDRPNQYEDFKMIYNENRIPIQVQKTGTIGNDYTQNITYNNQKISFTIGSTNYVIEDPDIDKGTFSKYKRNNISYTFQYASDLKNGLTQQHRLDLFMALIDPSFNYSLSYLTGYFFSQNIIRALDEAPSPNSEHIEIEKSHDGYITKRRFITSGGDVYTSIYFYE
ncbi:hypothetical protein SAMN05421741_12435 [Paenimyroides ummariense]|uniref:YD repeat-containing protein n=1 Tax=Paenimyroides ummariense TaxID=913024 RepID=A0A1I5F380_9FLAO|nr:hypothetical protein [Paenimyroides ummariense]SFO18167.1 hypothetical protein SAMN05421741_12435 [Paenimyroides ummariense]